MILALLAVLVPSLDINVQLDVHVDARQLRYAIHTSGHPTAPATSSPEVERPPVAPSGYDHIPDHWLELARCESGNWVDGGASFTGPIRWDWGAPDMQRPPWGTDLHHGAWQFAPSTWEWVAGDLGLLKKFPHAYDAPPEVQFEVAQEVQRRQGWRAWPVCSRKVGLG